MVIRSQTLKKRLAISPPSHVYHYTNSRGLIGILESKKIWATNIRFLNDINEVIEATKTAKEILNEKLEASEDERMRHLFKSMLDNIEEVASHIYVCSFSADGNSLSQWRAYCPSTGGGYALGIPGPQLRDVAKKLGWMFVKCIYENEKKDQVIREIIDSFIEDFEYNYDSDSTERVALNFKLHLLGISGVIKNKAFENEKEWRLISPILSNEESINFRQGKSGIIPYCKFELLEKDNQIIKNQIKLVVGPTPQNDSESRQSARYILSKYLNSNTGEVLSKIPYKGW